MPDIRKIAEDATGYAVGTILTAPDHKIPAFLATGAWEAGKIKAGVWEPFTSGEVEAAPEVPEVDEKSLAPASNKAMKPAKDK